MKRPLNPFTKFKRGDTTPALPGLIFWGIHRGEEMWVLPDRFEKMRQVKNASARRCELSPEAKDKKEASRKLRAQKPEFKKRSNAYQRKMRSKYSPRYRDKRRAYKKMRRQTDPIFRLKSNIGTTMRIALKRRNTRKSNHINELLGCTYDFFRGWLESQFDPAMTWMNYGIDWHVDHILAIDLFDIIDPVKQKMAFNYRNCRPLWGRENLSKNNRLDPALIEKYHLEAWIPFMIPQNIIPFKAA